MTNFNTRVFISHCSDDLNKLDMPQKIIRDIRDNNFDLVYDKTDVKFGDNINLWMEEEIEKADVILLFCTPSYKKKADHRDGGVGKEIGLMQRYLNYRSEDAPRIIPLLIEGDMEKSIPNFCCELFFMDFTCLEKYYENVDSLIEIINGLKKPEKQKELLEEKFHKRIEKRKFGVIVAGDIVNFSNYSLEEQENILTNMQDFLIKTRKERKDFRHISTYILTNGIILTVPDTEPRKILKFVEDWIQIISSEKPHPKLRVGLHCGFFKEFFVSDEDRRNCKVLFGSSLDECYQIAKIGDSESIVLSEIFLKYWVKFVDKLSFFNKSIFPNLGEPPITIFTEQGTLQYVRVYSRNGSELLAPPKLSMLNLVDDMIKKYALTNIENLFLGLLDDLNSQMNKDNIRPRVTFFVPNPANREELVPTYCVGKISRGSAAITYSINGRGEGPIGKAYASRQMKPVILKNLPEYGRAHKNYIQKLKEWDVSEKKIRCFGRKSRAFCVFPVMLAGHCKINCVTAQKFVF